MKAFLLDEKAAAGYLGGARSLSVKTLQQWRYCRVGPAWVRIGRLIRYRQTDLDAYIESRVQHQTSEGIER